MLRTDDFIPFAAPSTAAFAETNRQDSRFACIAPKGRGIGMCRVSSPKGRCMDAARCQRDRKSLLATLVESEERKEKAATGGLFFGYFLLAAQKKVTRLRVR
jgi:hypothetical protein